MASKVIRNITKVFRSASGVLFGRKTAGTGRGEELTPSDVRTLLSVYTISQTDTAISTAVNTLIAGAPGLLDTLDELSAALGDDANFAATVTTALAGKAATSHSHAQSDITDLTTDLAAKAAAATTISAGTGLSGGGSLAANRTITLANTAVTAGSYTAADITVDAQGRITAAANGSGGGGSPSGSTKQVQFNSASSFGGASGFEYQSGASPNVLIVSQSAAYVPFCIKGAASQSANLQEWQNSSGVAGVLINSSRQIVFDYPSGSQLVIRYANSAVGGIYFDGTNYGVGLSGGATVDTWQSSGSLRMRQNNLLGWTGSTSTAVSGLDTALSRNAAGVVEINSGTAGTFRDLKLRDMTASGLVCAGTYTVGTLPSAAANAYKFANVSDSSVTTNGTTVAGGGSSKVMVYSNGTDWKVVVA